ncbi:MAG: peptidase C13 [Lysobacterales bacterium 14-68-21]|nr:MAG: peptidase C13 [Xanthomonadales bacterium 15-68-25]OZB67751.1 MAG: peptidase C13 [Xanthomonadales bacterium 14-68-21]
MGAALPRRRRRCYRLQDRATHGPIMPNLLALALLMAPAAAPGDDFHDRITRGRLAEAAATGPAYQKTLWAKIGDPMTDALKGCIARNHDADRAPFTLVADVGGDGHPSRVEVQPATVLATCLASSFTTWTLPTPPKDPKPYPIEIDVSITR